MARVAAVLARALPAVLLPGAIAIFQGSTGTPTPLFLLVAVALGIAISVAVRNGLLAILTTAVSLGLLLSAAYVEELQAAEKEIGHQPGRHMRPVPSPDGVAPLEILPAAPAAKFLGRPDDGLAPVTMETMSVVLPCAYEGAYAGRTVEALRKHTKRRRLKEIIVVDDGSNPPLVLPESLIRGSGGEAPVRMLRHATTRGLIAAKKTGGDAAIGDVIVFFDCHIRPRDGWEEAFLRQMKRAGDHRTVVVPTITSLDPDTWEENNYASASKACYMLWNADFTWLGDPGRDVPLMSGGLLALSRRWWQETEGYDDRMVAWGGENIDQSLRAWLCGGRIEVAEGAFVAHMWRDPRNPKTQLKYPIPTEDVMRNKARAATAWMGEFTAKTMSFPEYEQFTSGRQQIGDMQNFERLKRKLKCAPFSAYLQRFSYVYVDSGLIPKEVFQIREESTGRCLERAPRENPPHGVVLAPCAGEGGKGNGGVPELQLWHLGNRDRNRRGGPCCSGLMNWNFIQCLDASSIGSRLQTFECQIAGHSNVQHFKLRGVDEGSNGGQIIWQDGRGCVLPIEQAQPVDTLSHDSVCSLAVEPLDGASADAVSRGGASFRLRQRAGEGGGGLCLRGWPVPGHETGDDKQWQIGLADCEEGNPEQVFRSAMVAEGLRVEVGSTGWCLDAAAGRGAMAYPCYGEDSGNRNQMWRIRNVRSTPKLVWEGSAGGHVKAFCVAAAEPGRQLAFREVPLGQRPVLRSCAGKRGQRLSRHDVQTSGEEETFLLKDEDTGECLGVLGAGQGGALEHPLVLGDCSPKQRWVELRARDQVQFHGTVLCIDAGDEVTPIAYPCHEPKAQRKQRFRVLTGPGGGVQLQSGWEDNGRKRYFEQCLDHAPEPLLEVAVDRCSNAHHRGVRWRKVGSRSTLEYELWSKVPPPPPGDPGLGGGAAPP